ncbi:MAG: hypothetical protein RL077_4539, partial [Verrucomicrobiota bacterium]
MKVFSSRLTLLTFLLLAAGATAAETTALFTATPLTAIGSFTKGVEGPACDAQGQIYAVNFGEQRT